MSTEQIVRGIPDMLILMEEMVKMAEKNLVFSKTSNAVVQGGPFPGETPLISWDLQMHVVHSHDAFSPLPLPPKNYQVMLFLIYSISQASSYILK